MQSDYGYRSVSGLPLKTRVTFILWSTLSLGLSKLIFIDARITSAIVVHVFRFIFSYYILNYLFYFTVVNVACILIYIHLLC